MRLNEVAEKLGATVLTHRDKASRVDVQHVYAGDRMSNLLSEGTDTTLLVTNLSNALLPRVAELVDAAGICLVNGGSPDPGVIKAADEHGIVLMVSPADMFETCGLMYQYLDATHSVDQ